MSKRVLTVKAAVLSLLVAASALTFVSLPFRRAPLAAAPKIVVEDDPPMFYAAPAFSLTNDPQAAFGTVFERNGSLKITAYYPQTESEKVNESVKSRVSGRIADFKKNWRYGSLDILFETYRYNDAIISVVFDIYAYNPQRGVSVSRETGVFDLIGGVEMSADDVLAEGWLEAAGAGGGSRSFAFDDDTVYFYTEDGRKIEVPTQELGEFFLAGKYIERYYSQDKPDETLSGAALVAPGKYIAITFDDGPHRTYTNQILDALDKYGAKATFFELGHRMTALPDVVRRVVDEGHSVGNHSYDHKQLTRLTETQIAKEIDDTNIVLYDITGIKTEVLRPPYGATNRTVERLAKDRGLAVINWDIDPEDWRGKSASVIADHIINRAKEWDIILLHDLYKGTAEATPIILEALTKKGFKFVTVEELIRLNQQRLEAGKVYRSALQ